MLIDIELLTKPKTIPRIEASKQIERTATTIDKVTLKHWRRRGFIALRSMIVQKLN
jgi:hypothetical protein